MTFAVAASATVGAQQGTTLPKNELPAPPDRFVVTTGAGLRLTAAAARVDIKHWDAANAPEVEIFISASGGSGRVWVAQIAAPADFVNTLRLRAPVVDRPLEVGEATVSVTLRGGDITFASSGLVQLRLQARWVVGEASGMSKEFSAKFEGPLVVTCAVPAAALTARPPAPASKRGLPMLVIDERFESTFCQRYAALARGSR
jgi:hypothetical protein